MATAEPQKAIPIEALNPQQLLMVKKNVEEVFLSYYIFNSV